MTHLAAGGLVPAILGLATLGNPSTGAAQALLAPSGTSAVGYWHTSLTTGRPDSSVSRLGFNGRTLFIECWYPASGPGATGSTKRYTSSAIERTLQEQLGLRLNWAGSLITHAVEGLLLSSGQHPVVVFSHGLSWPVALYQTITEDLASRGYVVIAINHPHGTAIDYGGDHILGFDPVPTLPSDSATDAFLAQATAVWDDDIRAVLDQLPRWNTSGAEAPFARGLDLARIALVGHSLGGSAAALLSTDSRVKAVVALEGKFRGVGGTSFTVHAPFLHMIGEYNRLELENRDYRPSENAPVYQAVLAGTGHAYFSDLIAIYKASADPDWLARHRYELEPQRIIQITRDYIAAFLRRWLLGTDNALLHPTSYAARVDGPRAAGYAEVRLTIDY